MEPIITSILAALAAGALAKSKDVASQAVTDAYDGLKSLIVRKLGKGGAVQSVEDEPESQAAHAALAEALAGKQLQADAELNQKAQELDKILAEAKASGAAGVGDIEIGRVHGKVNAIVENLVASGRIKIDSVESDGTARVSGIRAGTAKN